MNALMYVLASVTPLFAFNMSDQTFSREWWGPLQILHGFPNICYRWKNLRSINPETPEAWLFCFVHPIFLSFGFWYFGHLMLRDFIVVFFHLAHLALKNVCIGYVIFSYFRIFAKSCQKPETKNGMNETITGIWGARIFTS